MGVVNDLKKQLKDKEKRDAAVGEAIKEISLNWVNAEKKIVKLELEIERLRGMLALALDGLDDYWVTLPQGIELVNQIKALAQKENA